MSTTRKTQMVTLRNEFHGTEATVRAGELSARTVRRVRAALCTSECKCSGDLGTRGPQSANIARDSRGYTVAS